MPNIVKVGIVRALIPPIMEDKAVGRREMNWTRLRSELKFLFPVAPLDDKGARFAMLDKLLFGPAGDGTTEHYYAKFKKGESTRTEEYKKFVETVYDLLELLALRHKYAELGDKGGLWWQEFLNIKTIEIVSGGNLAVSPLDLLGAEGGLEHVKAILIHKIKSG